MIPLSRELHIKLNWFTSNEGTVALEELSAALWDYYSNQCATSEGNQLYRDQGAAQLAKWLKTLPKGLRDGNGASPVNLD